MVLAESICGRFVGNRNREPSIVNKHSPPLSSASLGKVTKQMSSPQGIRRESLPAPSLDRPLHAAVARFTGGVSPAALSQAYIDWLQHFLFSPDKQIELLEKAVGQWARYLQYCPRACADPNCARCIEPLPQDKRFRAEAWQQWPFNAIYQGFLLSQQGWHIARAWTGFPNIMKMSCRSLHGNPLMSFRQ